MFLLVPAHPGSPDKDGCVCVCVRGGKNTYNLLSTECWLSSIVNSTASTASYDMTTNNKFGDVIFKCFFVKCRFTTKNAAEARPALCILKQTV